MGATVTAKVKAIKSINFMNSQADQKMGAQTAAKELIIRRK